MSESELPREIDPKTIEIYPIVHKVIQANIFAIINILIAFFVLYNADGGQVPNTSTSFVWIFFWGFIALLLFISLYVNFFIFFHYREHEYDVIDTVSKISFIIHFIVFLIFIFISADVLHLF